MEDRDPPSLAVRVAGPPLFILGAIAALYWFGFSLIILLVNLNEEIVNFDKGAFYLLGVGFGLATLSFVLVYEFWYGRSLTKRLTSVCTKLALASVVLMLLLPQVIHLLTDNYLKNRDFTVCEQASSQWLFVREIVYVDSIQICDKAIKTK